MGRLNVQAEAAIDLPLNGTEMTYLRVMVPLALRQELVRAAAERGLSVTYIVRRALADQLEVLEAERESFDKIMGEAMARRLAERFPTL